MTKGEAWKQWWSENHGKNQPMGGYHPMEGYIYDAWSAGWDAKQCCTGDCKQGRECPLRK